VIVSIYIYVLTPTTVLAFVGVKITEGLCFLWYYIVVVVNVSVYVCALSVEKIIIYKFCLFLRSLGVVFWLFFLKECSNFVMSLR
jgi:hypothetical protein